MANNDILFDAAIAGITGGALAGQDFTQISAATIATGAGASQQAAILAAAAEIDAAIPFDATLSVSAGSGVLLVTPYTGSGSAAAILPQFSKPQVLAQVCAAAFDGRPPTSTVAGSYATLAAGIAAQYAAAVTQLKGS